MAHRIAKYNICAEFWGDEHHCRPPQYKFWGDVFPRPPVIYAHATGTAGCRPFGGRNGKLHRIRNIYRLPYGKIISSSLLISSCVKSACVAQSFLHSMQQ